MQLLKKYFIISKYFINPKKNKSLKKMSAKKTGWVYDLFLDHVIDIDERDQHSLDTYFTDRYAERILTVVNEFGIMNNAHYVKVRLGVNQTFEKIHFIDRTRKVDTRLCWTKDYDMTTPVHIDDINEIFKESYAYAENQTHIQGSGLCNTSGTQFYVSLTKMPNIEQTDFTPYKRSRKNDSMRYIPPVVYPEDTIHLTTTFMNMKRYLKPWDDVVPYDYF